GRKRIRPGAQYHHAAGGLGARAARHAIGFAPGAADVSRQPQRPAVRDAGTRRALAPRCRSHRVRLMTTDDPKARIEAALRAALAKVAPGHADASILLERPKQAAHGDFSSNIALQLAKNL